MLVSNRHVQEQTDLRPSHAREMWLDLLDAERALRHATACDRVNVVKFGNVVRHLHWHLVPRYAEEIHGTLTPWEVLQANPVLKADGTLPKSALVYRDRANPPWHAQGLLVGREDLLSRVREDFRLRVSSREPAVFGAALFLRPAGAALREEAQGLPLPELLARARANPVEWESFLMKRNYLDRSWDHFGGNADPGEFPEETMRREVREELGWEVQEAVEVTRQWSHGSLQGFVFLVRPRLAHLPRFDSDGTAWMNDTPPRTACDEVAEAAWVNLGALVRGEAGKRLIQAAALLRHKALVEGRADFLVPSARG